MAVIVAEIDIYSCIHVHWLRCLKGKSTDIICSKMYEDFWGIKYLYRMCSKIRLINPQLAHFCAP